MSAGIAMAKPMIVVSKASAMPSEKMSDPPLPPDAGIAEKTLTSPVTVPSRPMSGAPATTTSSKNNPFDRAATSSRA